ncbi:MAG: LapA family protein [Bacteroidia bacterium]|nr:LapA family protein [Bacteroidia bacterium]
MSANEIKESSGVSKIIAAIVLSILMIIFALQNKDDVMVSLWFWQISLPLALWLMVMFIGGFLISLLVSGPMYFKSKDKSLIIKDLETRIKNHELKTGEKI